MTEASNSNHGTLLGESQFTRSPMYFDVKAQQVVDIELSRIWLSRSCRSQDAGWACPKRKLLRSTMMRSTTDE